MLERDQKRKNFSLCFSFNPRAIHQIGVLTQKEKVGQGLLALSGRLNRVNWYGESHPWPPSVVWQLKCSSNFNSLLPRLMRSRALRETEIEIKTDRFSKNRKPTDGRFLKYRFSVFPILVCFGFKARFFLHIFFDFFVLFLTDFLAY
jgi:hypothetical protein